MTKFLDWITPVLWTLARIAVPVLLFGMIAGEGIMFLAR